MNELIMLHCLFPFGLSYQSTFIQVGLYRRTILGLLWGQIIKIFIQTRKLDKALFSLCKAFEALGTLTRKELKLDLYPTLLFSNSARQNTLCLFA